MLTLEEQKENYDMSRMAALAKESLNKALQTTGSSIGQLGGGYNLSTPANGFDWAKYAQQTASQELPIRERLSNRRKNAEAELIRLNKLQDLIDSLPADMTDADLRSLINI